MGNAILNRPVRVLGFITAFHSIIYGIGYLTNWGGFDGALVGLQISNLLVNVGLGAVLTFVGAGLMYAYSVLNPKTIRALSYLQGLAWLFVTLLYIINGAFLLALGIGVTWSVVSVYISFATKNRKNIIIYDSTPQAIQDTRDEDTL